MHYIFKEREKHKEELESVKLELNEVKVRQTSKSYLLDIPLLNKSMKYLDCLCLYIGSLN